MSKITDLSIIIVNFNTKFFLGECLRSIFASDLNSCDSEVIVVDNASTDGSAQEIQKLKVEIQNLRLIQNKTNLGFAAGNNIGIRVAKGRYILLLNSDTGLSESVLTEMIRFMDHHPEAGAATCRLSLTSGQIDPACHRGFPTPWAALTYFSGLVLLGIKLRSII